MRDSLVFKKYFYNKDKIDFGNLLFEDKALIRLLIPLIFEQLLNSLMGMVDTVMVSNVGSVAISAVSLVDSINILIIQVFAALATGGTIVCSQYIGHGDKKAANKAAGQVVLTILVLSGTIMTICLTMRRPLLSLIFGQVEDAVMRDALTYFLITAISFPFFSLFQAGSAFFRAGGNSKYPMLISVSGNMINIIGNAILIFGFKMGVMGAALATLISRFFCFAVVFYSLRKPKQEIVIRSISQLKPDFGVIKKVLSIGVPSGVENGMFQFGKLAIQSSVSTLATAAIAAQAMTIIFETLNSVAGLGIGIALMTVIGQSLGAGRTEEARYYMWKLTKYAHVGILICCLIVLAITKPVLIIAAMEPESAALCFSMVVVITIFKPLFWPMSFVPAYGLRAAGDVKFSMIVGTTTMWVFRVLICIYLIRVRGFGPIAVWIGMITDWAVRSVAFFIRLVRGKWLRHRVI